MHQSVPGTNVTNQISPSRARWLGLARLRAAVVGLMCVALHALPQLALAQSPTYGNAADVPAMRRVSGMIMLDYSAINLRGGGDFDLLSYRYLQQANDWLYFGVGAFAPMVRGNYGGFYGADATLHAQTPIAGNWFVNGGLSVGVGAGGSSVNNIRQFSGQGLYGRAYVGIGYSTRHLSFGVNYSRVAIAESPINDAGLNFFVQRRLGFSVGSYADTGRRLRADQFESPRNANILSFQVSNIEQISPTGSYGGPIGVISPQFTHFLNRDYYTFFGVEIGYAGLDWYNQAQAGFGRRFALSPRVNLYGQIGLGSGGWVTDTINTGSGVVIYPKVTLEYMLNDTIGAQLSAGYFLAPTGTSRNWTIGAGLSYHLSGGNSQQPGVRGDDYALHGVRLNVFGRATSPINYNGRTTEGIALVAVQADYTLSRHWYASAQIAAAATDFRGYAGYAEGFFGLGWQSNPSRSGRFQGYAQLMYGLNDVGVTSGHYVGPLIYPAIGANFHVNDRLSIYGQIGAAYSIGHLIDSNITNQFSNFSLGLGVTYRFSLPSRT